MTDQPPTYQQPPTHQPNGIGSQLTGGVLGIIGAVVALVTVVGSYVIVRWLDDPGVVFTLFVGVCLVALAVLALLAGRRNALAPFVAIALLLPFFSVLSAGFALGQRIEDSLEDLFGSSDSEDSLSFGDDEEEADAAEDAVALGEEGTSGMFTVVVSGVECTDTLTDAERNPDWDYTDETKEYVDVEAPDGKQFCVVASTWTNSSKEPDSIWMGLGKLVTADGTSYAPTDDDSGYSRRMAEQAGYDGSTLNPGDTAEVRSVFTVPAGVEATHAVAEGFGFDEPSVWFELE